MHRERDTGVFHCGDYYPGWPEVEDRAVNRKRVLHETVNRSNRSEIINRYLQPKRIDKSLKIAILIIAHLPCVEGVPKDVLLSKASFALCVPAGTRSNGWKFPIRPSGSGDKKAYLFLYCWTESSDSERNYLSSLLLIKIRRKNIWILFIPDMIKFVCRSKYLTIYRNRCIDRHKRFLQWSIIPWSTNSCKSPWGILPQLIVDHSCIKSKNRKNLTSDDIDFRHTPNLSLAWLLTSSISKSLNHLGIQ